MIAIGRYQFEGPFRNTGQLRDEQGIYAVLCQPLFGNATVLDIGESETVKTRVENHERASCWRRHCGATLSVAALYTPGSRADQRRAVEHNLRQQFSPYCGDR